MQSSLKHTWHVSKRGVGGRVGVAWGSLVGCLKWNRRLGTLGSILEVVVVVVVCDGGDIK